MKSPRKAIIKGFYNALSNITYAGQLVPVYSASPLKAPNNPYIQIGSVTTVEEGCKDLFGHACTIDIQVIDSSRDNYATPRAVEEITELVMQTLKPLVLSVVELSDFYMINLVLTNTIQDPNIFETAMGYRNIMQWSFDVYELQGEAIWLLLDGIWNDSGVWVDSEYWYD